MAERDRAIRQMQGALRSAPYYDGTGLWSTFSFEWKNWCPLAWTGGNADLITDVEKKRILVTRIRGQAVARFKAYEDGSTAWTDAPTLEKYLEGIYQALSYTTHSWSGLRDGGSHELLKGDPSSDHGYDVGPTQAYINGPCVANQKVELYVDTMDPPHLPKDRGWNLIARYTLDANNKPVAGEWNKGDIAQPIFSNLKDLAQYCRSGSFQFFLWYPDLGPGNEWIQRSNLITQERGQGSKEQKSTAASQKEQRKSYRCHKQGQLPGKPLTGQQQQKRQRQGIHGLTEKPDVVDPFLDDSDE